MSRVAPVVLLCVAALLAWALYLGAGESGEGNPAAPVPHRVIATVAGTEPSAAEVPIWLATIVARPLFNQGRRPLTVRPAAGAKADPEERAPRLAGVLVSAGGRAAIFSQPGQKPTVAREGDRVGPYLVRSIAAGQVTVIGPRGVAILRPSFADEAAGPATAAASAPAATSAPTASTVGAPKSLLDRLLSQPASPPAVPSPEMLREIFARQQAAAAAAR